MSDELNIFGNLPRRRRGPDDDERSERARALLTLNFVEEGPLPPRPHRSGVGGPSVNQGTATPPVTSVWSAADAAANGMTLSNGGLTVTPSGASSWQSIRGSISKSAGKLYFELLTTASVPSSGSLQIGVASGGTFNIASYLGNSNYSAGLEAGYVSPGFVSNYTAGLTISINDVFAVAIDFTAGSIWLADSGVWFNSSNPATGALPIVSFTPATVGPLFPAMGFYGGTLLPGFYGPKNLGVWTLQPTAASQKYAPPAGFTPWG